MVHFSFTFSDMGGLEFTSQETEYKLRRGMSNEQICYYKMFM